MKKTKEPDHSVDLNRRGFMKLGATSAVAGTAAMTPFLSSKVFADVASEVKGKKTHNSFPIKIDESVYKRYHMRDHAFGQVFGGKFPEGEKALFEDLFIPLDKDGFRQVDKAFVDASWEVEMEYSPYSAISGHETPAYARNKKVAKEKHKFASSTEATRYVKKAARFLGADLVGITAYDERWTYASFYDMDKNDNIPPDLPFTPKSVIVLAFEMDYEGMSTGPAGPCDAATGLAYSRMAFTGSMLRKFLTGCGYKTFASGNDVALSIPYAVAAGLGEPARNGILVTSEYGPRVRLAKVFTELELDTDKPVTFGVRHFCENCMRCADACPSNAISHDKKPSFKVINECNNPGVEKWSIDAKKCLVTWGKLSSDCSSCIISCPYNKPDFWHHRLVDKLNKVMPESVHAFMREMDILFGYGNTFDAKALEKFWKS